MTQNKTKPRCFDPYTSYLLTNPTLILKSNESTKVVSPMQYSVDPTLLLWSDVSFEYVFIISSSVPSEQERNQLSLSILLPTPGMVSFVWNDLVEPCLPSYTPFHIMVKVNLMGAYQCRSSIES